MQGHEKWLEIAQYDLKVSRALYAKKFFIAVVYHCQQASEKALKAYLVFQKQPILKTHDLIKLLELCMLFDIEFCEKFDAADYVNPFSTKFRYPSEFDIPDQNDAKLAIKHSASIIKLVIKKVESQESRQQKIF